MLNREIGITGQIPQNAAQQPTASKARVEGERPFNQSYSDIDVVAQKSDREPGKGEDIGVVRGEPERPASQVETLATVGLPVVCPVVRRKELMTVGSQGEVGAVMRIAFDRLPEQVERPKDAVPLDWAPVRQCTQVKVVGGQIIGWPGSRAVDLGRLQGRLDHADGARRDLVLKLEDIFQRPIEAVGPEDACR